MSRPSIARAARKKAAPKEPKATPSRVNDVEVTLERAVTAVETFFVKATAALDRMYPPAAPMPVDPPPTRRRRARKDDAPLEVNREGLRAGEPEPGSVAEPEELE